MRILSLVVLSAFAVAVSAVGNGTITVTAQTPRSAAGGWIVTVEGVAFSQYPNGKAKVSSTGKTTQTEEGVQNLQNNKVRFQMPTGMGQATLVLGNHTDTSLSYDTVVTTLSTNIVPADSAAKITLSGANDFSAALSLAQQTNDWSVSASGSAATVNSVASGGVEVEIPAKSAGVINLVVSAKSVALSIGSCSGSCLKAQATSPAVTMKVAGTVATFNPTSFKNTLVRLMNLENANQIYISSVTSGSVVVVFRVLNTDTQTNAASGAQSKLEQLAADGSLAKDLGTEELTVGSTQVTVKKAATSTDDDDDDEVPAGLIGGIVGGVVGGILLIGIAYFIFKRTSGGQQLFRNYGQGNKKGTPGPAFSQPSTQTDNEVGLV